MRRSFYEYWSGEPVSTDIRRRQCDGFTLAHDRAAAS